MLTEAGSKKRAGVWLLDARGGRRGARAPRARRRYGLGAERLAAILAGESRRLHSLLRDQRVIAGIGRAWANEILHAARLSPYALSTQLDEEEVARLAAAIDAELARGLELRERGASDAKTYRVHNRLGEPCHVCGTPLARVDFEEHTIYYCPDVPDRRPDAQGPPDVAAAALSRGLSTSARCSRSPVPCRGPCCP